MKSITRYIGHLFIVLALGVAVSACGLSTIVSTAFTTTTWYVTTGGNDTHDCLTAATACRTIDAAMTKATTGLVVIQVGPGTSRKSPTPRFLPSTRSLPAMGSTF